jgi:soluble lytic murein transglycosylase-like protein
MMPGSSAYAALEDLARASDWARVLEVASRRGEQLPLNAAEAMIAAHAARLLGDRPAEIRFLKFAAAGNDDDLSELAKVQLAAALLPDDPWLAVDLALPVFDRGRPWALRESASKTVISAVAGGLDADLREAVQRATGRLPVSLRRQLELALAFSDSEHVRSRLDGLLADSTRDLVALEAAEALSEMEALTPLERWRVASTYYRHAMYDRAAPELEQLENVRQSTVPADEVLFTRGRCAFRNERWAEAIHWYQKALGKTRTGKRRAEYEVHIGRSHELAGDLDEAVDAAVRAVRLNTTDERRLFLARLRLRRGEPDAAVQGISRLRGRTARARGDFMLATDAIRRGDLEAARDRLERVRRRPWSGPAAVLAAHMALSDGDWETGIEKLERGAPAFDSFWGQQARTLMAAVPEQRLDRWRGERRRDADDTTGRSRWRALGLWAQLEPDQSQFEDIRRRVAAESNLGEVFAIEWFPPGLAAELWDLGLEAEAGKWDPTGFPHAEAVRSAWSAARFAAFGMPWSAVRTADAAWRQAGSEVPMVAFPVDFQKTAYPLPYREEVRDASRRAGLEWQLLASVAREESRWNPRAFSIVGARGLVQLMPATARSVAGRLGTAPPEPADLFDPATSLRLGAAELARLLDVFGGRAAPAIAAYNAGEQQAKLWLEQCGAGCTDALFVANISFTATRAYTSTVLAGASIYESLYEMDDDRPSPADAING